MDANNNLIGVSSSLGAVGAFTCVNSVRQVRCGLGYTLETSSGHLCFKKAGKFVAFGPGRVASGPGRPTVVIANFRVTDGRVALSSSSPLGRDVGVAGGVALLRSRSAFDFSFMTLDCLSPRRGECTCVLRNFSGR